jgi:hypothetical protein
MSAVALKQIREYAAQEHDAIEAGGIAESVWTESLSAFLDRLSAEDRSTATARLQAGEGAACASLRHALACRVAAGLAEIDDTIKAAYLLEEIDTAEEAWNEATPRTAAIQVILWVQPRTAALSALVDALDAALLPRYASLVGAEAMTRLLLVQLVDDAAVRDRVGFGLLLTSTRNRPLRIWERQA